MFVHVSPHRIAVGDFVLPSSLTGIETTYGPGRADAIARGQLDPTSVHVMCVESDAPIRGYSFAGPDDYNYEVKPIGELLDDPDPMKRPGWFRCQRARVLRCLYDPERRSLEM